MFDMEEVFAPTKGKIIATIVILLAAWFVGIALLSLVYSDPRFSLLWFVGILGYGLLDLGFSIGVYFDSFLLSFVLEALYIYALVSLVSYFFARRFSAPSTEEKEEDAP